MDWVGGGWDDPARLAWSGLMPFTGGGGQGCGECGRRCEGRDRVGPVLGAGRSRGPGTGGGVPGRVPLSGGNGGGDVGLSCLLVGLMDAPPRSTPEEAGIVTAQRRDGTDLRFNLCVSCGDDMCIMLILLF